MKKGNRVQILAVEGVEGNETFAGMVGTVKRSYPEGVIIDIDEKFLGDSGVDLFFEYCELEKI